MIGSLRELPISEKIQLVEDLWDSIAHEQEALAMSDEQRAELDRRLDDYEGDGIIGRSAEDVMTDIRKRL
ncbi:MAG: addiction module protein [Desulfobacterales bacterium]|nr:addiction module protein [Desulfobacterales bacterium]